MNRDTRINKLRHLSRKLIRELGMLQLNSAHLKRTPQHWHALIEISKENDLTISHLAHLLLVTTSATSRIVNALLKDKLISFKYGIDKREKYLSLTEKGCAEVKYIDEFSNTKIKGAFEYLREEDQDNIIIAIEKYSEALEMCRLLRKQVKIHTISTSRPIRKQIINMIETIQRDEFSLPITSAINAGILKAEDEFYYNNSYNFWYATDHNGIIIGSIGLKKISEHAGEIKKFFVDKKYRSKGIAQKLMHTLMKVAVKHQFRAVYLGTVQVLQGAHRFYEKYGFMPITKKQLPSTFSMGPLDTLFFKGDVEKCMKLLQNLT